jgi:hypothetical protein
MKGITAIPPCAFFNVGTPQRLQLDENRIESVTDVTWPSSLQQLSLMRNKLTINSLLGVSWPWSDPAWTINSGDTQYLFVGSQEWTQANPDGLVCVPISQALYDRLMNDQR